MPKQELSEKFILLWECFNSSKANAGVVNWNDILPLHPTKNQKALTMQLRRMDDIIPALRANIAAIAAEAAGVSANPTNPATKPGQKRKAEFDPDETEEDSPDTKKQKLAQSARAKEMKKQRQEAKDKADAIAADSLNV